MRIEQLTISGLKGGDRTYDLHPTNYIVGPNGTGKSALFTAIRLLALGASGLKGADDRGVPATMDGVMRMARGDLLQLSARIRLDNGKIATVKRRWARDGEGSVTESFPDWTGLPGDHRTNSKTGRATYIRGLLAAYTESWFPQDLLGLSPDKLRARLLRLIPEHELNLADWVPQFCPKWALPSSEDHPLLEWVADAIKKADRYVLDKQAERRKAEAHAEDLGDGWKGEQSIEPLQIRLAELRELQAGADRRRDQANRVNQAARQLDDLRRSVEFGLETQAPVINLVAGLTEAIVAACRESLGPVDEQIAALEGSLKGSAYDQEIADIRKTLKGLSAPSTAIRMAPNPTRARLSGELSNAKNRLAALQVKLSQLGEISTATDAELQQAANELENARSALQQLGRDRARLDGQIAIFVGGENPLPSCPHCGVVLEDAWQAIYRETTKKLETVLENTRLTEDNVRHWEAKHAWAIRGIQKANLREEEASLKEALTQVEQQLARLDAEDAAARSAEVEQAKARKASLEARLAELEHAAAEARRGIEEQVAELRAQFATMPSRDQITSALRSATRWREELARAEALAARVSDLELDLEVAKSDLAELRQVDEQAIAAEVADCEKSIEEVGRSNERADLLAAAKATLGQIDVDLFELQGWAERFRKIQTDLLDRTKIWLETRFSRALGSHVRVDLQDPRGNPTCRLSVDGVDISTISDGEFLTFVAGILVALSEGHKGENCWRPLFVDRVESISADRREQFLRAIASCVAEGLIDQAFLAGCPDVVECPEDLHLISLQAEV